MQTLSLLRQSAALFGLALGMGASAWAQSEAPATEGTPQPAATFERELWVTSGFLSHHTQHASRYNQHNDGLGLEWRWSSSLQLNAGHYRNSVRHGSTYFQAGWTPLDYDLGADFRLHGGASVGVINGYPKVRHGGYFGTLVPAVSLEWGRVGMNFLYIPSVGKRVDGAFAVQLKLRAF